MSNDHIAFSGANLHIDVFRRGSRVVSLSTSLGEPANVLSDETFDSEEMATKAYAIKCESFAFVGFEPVEESE